MNKTENVTGIAKAVMDKDCIAIRDFITPRLVKLVSTDVPANPVFSISVRNDTVFLRGSWLVPSAFSISFLQKIERA